MTAAIAAALLARIGIVILFLPFSALDKLLNFRGALAQCEETFRPRVLAIAGVVAGLAVETVCTTGVVAGVADRAAAVVLAGYCAATAILFKRFWQPGDFLDGSQSAGRLLFWDFLKNLSLGAGFLLVAVGPDGRGLAPFLAHPLASSHPYAASPAAAAVPVEEEPS